MSPTASLTQTIGHTHYATLKFPPLSRHSRTTAIISISTRALVGSKPVYTPVLATGEVK